MKGSRVAIVIGAGLLVGAVAVWRGGLLRPASDDDPAAQRAALVAQGKAAYRRVEMVPLASLNSLSDVESLLSGMLRQDEPRWRSLRTAVAEFIYYRFLQGSVDQYKLWRRAGGYRFMPADELKHPWLVDSDYQEFFGEPYPGDDRIEEVFDRFWEWALTTNGSAPRLIASDGLGINVVTGTLTSRAPRRWPMLQGELGAELWHGRIAGTHRRWWRKARDLPELLDRGQEVEVAVVGIIIEGSDGVRRPYHLGYAWDPTDRNWTLVKVNTANFDTTVTLEY